MLEGSSFGESGKEVVIEEFLEGEETSLHLFGENYVTLPMSRIIKDWRRDIGLNTGGMNIRPQSLFSRNVASYEESIVRPTLAGLKEDGIDFRDPVH